MDNDYKSYYLKDLIPIINDVALDCMMTPLFGIKMCKSDGTSMTLAEFSNHNSLVSIHNEGVKELASRLKDRLLDEEDEDG